MGINWAAKQLKNHSYVVSHQQCFSKTHISMICDTGIETRQEEVNKGLLSRPRRNQMYTDIGGRSTTRRSLA